MCEEKKLLLRQISAALEIDNVYITILRVETVK